eukprot:366474-Chlamydomonas_euryale.AAC.7
MQQPVPMPCACSRPSARIQQPVPMPCACSRPSARMQHPVPMPCACSRPSARMQQPVPVPCACSRPSARMQHPVPMPCWCRPSSHSILRLMTGYEWRAKGCNVCNWEGDAHSNREARTHLGLCVGKRHARRVRRALHLFKPATVLLVTGLPGGLPHAADTLLQGREKSAAGGGCMVDGGRQAERGRMSQRVRVRMADNKAASGGRMLGAYGLCCSVHKRSQDVCN